ncbi:alpha-galactosidase [Rathayibacter sp. ZW T2_19]|uniref:Alpha-galactosidase n=1 Tax=Rathayibacter rubneri TaxID=2950106 RepID=A0A9X2DY44_9MICO|nr:glycoside hydrolase family 36 protein [Rathayibacter rubneri]MCM6761251.1 alpha-galactosidase [Rathayibacter rubneri]
MSGDSVQQTSVPSAGDGTDAGILLRGGLDGPVEFGGFAGTAPSLVSWRPVVEVFTADEQRARTSQSYVRSAVGERLRQDSLVEREREDAVEVTVTQSDQRTGVRVVSTFTRPRGLRALRITQHVVNAGSAPVVLTAVTSAVVGIGHAEADLDPMVLAWADSEWLAESRWYEDRLRDRVPALSLGIHAQDGRGRFALTSHGAWPTGEHLPLGVVVDPGTSSSLAWQIESGTAWQWSLGSTLDGGFLSLTGPADLEHHFAHCLAPGDSFTAAPAAVVVVDGARDEALTELTLYRRWLVARHGGIRGLPVIYNDFMNTLMGDPTSEKLRPLIAGAATAGAEVFCIDAGWFAGPGDWWNSVGEWAEDPDRFDGGFLSILDEIRSAGMIAGTWLEPEVVGVTSPMASSLPEEAFFQRFGARVVEHERYHLDFRHPAARAHLDAVVDGLVHDYGIGYLKLDYNINPGAGTERDATAAGDGLLAHSRAFVGWLTGIRERHPDLILENCSSGAMRMDYAYLVENDLQSTSDQQDFLRYPVIAAASPAAVLPEQSGNWAYPSAGMTEEETVFTLVTGLPGRLILSGFLDRLRPSQSALVAGAVAFAKEHRLLLARSTPFWPLGLPGWEDELVVVGFRDGDDVLLFVWDRGEHAAEFSLRVDGSPTIAFPRGDSEWDIGAADGLVQVRTAPGPSARVLHIDRRA